MRKTPTRSPAHPAVSGANFTSLVLGLKRGGVDVKKLKIVSFAGGGQSTMALLGGHIDILSTGLSNMAEHLQQGKMRLLVVSAPRRRPGIFSEVPTWKEIGIDMTTSTWRTVVAPKGLKPPQIAYWEGVFRKLVQTEDWKKDVADNHWENTYMPAAEAKKRLDQEYTETKQILLELAWKYMEKKRGTNEFPLQQVLQSCKGIVVAGAVRRVRRPPDCIRLPG